KADRFKQLIERARAALHHDESIRVFYQQRFSHKKIMEFDAAIEKRVWLLLELELDVATDRAAVDIFRPAIGCFHDPRPTPGHDGESELVNGRTHFTREFIPRMTFFYSERAVERRTRPNES